MLNTNPTAELNKLYKLETELDNGADTGTGFIQLEDLANEVFLIGGWRREKNQLDWILDHMMYNIRKTKRGYARSGALGVDGDVVTARYLILYEIGDDTYRYDVYRIDGHNVRNEEQMRKIGYPRPEGNYFVYSLKRMPRTIVPLNLKEIIDSAYYEELETRRRNGEIEDSWEKKWRGSPIFKTGMELIPFKK